MLKFLVEGSLRYRLLVVALSSALVVLGVVVAWRSPLDVFPEFAPPLVEMQVEAPGMSSEAVERLITVPLENAVVGAPALTTLRSKSVQGLSSVQMIFEYGTDIFQARQMVTERLGPATARLPEQAEPPRLLPPLSSTSRVLKLGLTAQYVNGIPLKSQTDISVLMRWFIEPRLLAVPGVANVSTYGQHDKQYQVLVKPGVLRAHGLTVEEIKVATRQAVVFGSAGFHDTPNQRLALQYSTRINRPEDIGQTVVAQRDGLPLLLNQVATVTTGNPPPIGEGVINDEPGLLVVIEKYPWANTLQVTRAVEQAVEGLKPSLPGVVMTTRIFRPATFIEQALGNLRFAMIVGCLLVAAIVSAFLLEWRTALISLTAIPMSILTAILILNLLNRLGSTINTINTMVLAGLAIAIGEVVDDAIIDVENIVRRLRLNREAGNPRSALGVVLDASLEVRSAVVYATFIVMFVCLPMFFMSGVQGAFFRPLALAYLLAVLASLGVAVTLTPALALLLLPGKVAQRRQPALARWVHAGYRRLLPITLGRRGLTLGLLVLLVAGSLALFVGFKFGQVPEFQESDFLMHWIAKPGTSIEVMRDNIVLVSKEMRGDPRTGVKEFGAHIARAEAGEEVVGPNFAELWISLGDFQGDYYGARRRIEALMARHPGYKHDLLTYLRERMGEVRTGTGADIVLRIYGADLDVLRAKAHQVRQAIVGGDGRGPIAGVVNLKVEDQVLVPQLELVVDPYRAAAHGLTPGAIYDNVRTLVNGSKVGQVHQEQAVFDVVVWADPEVRRTWHDLRHLDIDLPAGKGTVPLAAVADVRLVNAPNTVRHDWASRCIDVSCDVKGGNLVAVVDQIRERVAPLQEQGYRLEFLGEYKEWTDNLWRMMGVLLASFLGITLLLYIDFQSLRLTGLLLLTTVFALIGGVAAVALTGAAVSLGSLVGFITVLGIAGRNGIMLISHYRHLQLHEGMPFGRELIVRGALERVVPILMTALAAGLGLLPLAISGNKPGYEIEYPMAVVILGGLFTSTLLNLLVLPVLYERFGQRQPCAR